MSPSKPSYELPVGNKDRTKAAVVIIGAGISGICMAIDLIRRDKCQNFIILEKGCGFGGVWRDNVYPGCCCDIWSHLYSFSFEPNPEWTRKYSDQEEILNYLTSIAEKFGLYKHVRFNTTVEQAQWDKEEQKWKTTVRVTGGKDAEYRESYTITSGFLVSAVGQLNFPSYPDIPGLDNFKGKLMHSARWDLGYELEGKKIAVIGNGSTSAQIVPEVAKLASDVTVFQRSPNWVVPKSDAPITGLWKQALKLSPIRARHRADLMDTRESLHSAVFDASSYLSSTLRAMNKELMQSQLPNQPELWTALTPNFPPGCKRIIISDDYYLALNRKNVHLETRKIERFTLNGIQVEGAEENAFDLIVLDTGFRTLEFMHPIKITGRNDRSIEEIWHSGARAYKGVTVDSLPNFGMLYGPNTSVTHSSIILMTEAQSRYISALVKPVLHALQDGKTLSFSPKPGVVEDYNARIQKILNASSYAHPNCTSWFKTKQGKIITSWSGTVVEYQKELSEINWEEFDIYGTAKENLEGRSSHIGRVVEETMFSYRNLALASLSALSVAAMLLYRSQTPLRVG